MASVGLLLTAEMELVHDALADIEQIMRALVKCHGQPYRALERRVEQFMDGEVD